MNFFEMFLDNFVFKNRSVIGFDNKIPSPRHKCKGMGNWSLHVNCKDLYRPHLIIPTAFIYNDALTLTARMRILQS